MTGREMRLPLKMKGIGVGPKAQFSFDTLDIDNVFVNSKHSYEVIVIRKTVSPRPTFFEIYAKNIHSLNTLLNPSGSDLQIVDWGN